ncbi:MAG: Gfo/Idh/MocA family protein [Vicinamibacterales bacterium]
MATRLRWGLLSTSRINRVLLPVLRQLERHDVLAVASRDPERARTYARDWSIPHAEASYEALLARDDIDVVYVALPNALHAEWTIKALAAGKHVLCEKPLALSVTEVDAIMAASCRTGLRVAEAFMFRHHSQTHAIRRIVANGDLGEIRTIRAQFGFTLDRPADIRWVSRLGGGVLWDLGVYPLAFARAVLGQEPVTVSASTVIDEHGVDIDAAALVDFAGSRLTFDCSFRSPYRVGVEIVGAEGILSVPVPYRPGPSERVLLSKRNVAEPVSIPIEGAVACRGQLDDMASQVLDGEPPALPLDDSRANVRAMQAAQISARERRQVRIGEVRA